MSKQEPAAKRTLETVEPIGKRVLIRKDDDKKQTKSGIHLPDKIEIPTLTGRVIAVSAIQRRTARFISRIETKVRPAKNDSRRKRIERSTRPFSLPRAGRHGAGWK